DALVVVDLGPAVVVGADGVHAAGLLTGALQLDDGVVLAGLGAAAALDALVLLDVALAVDVADGVLGADLLAGPGQAAMAVLGDALLLGGAGVAVVVADVDGGRVVVLIGDGALAEALGDAGGVVHRLEGQAH